MHGEGKRKFPGRLYPLPLSHTQAARLLGLISHRRRGTPVSIFRCTVYNHTAQLLVATGTRTGRQATFLTVPGAWYRYGTWYLVGKLRRH